MDGKGKQLMMGKVVKKEAADLVWGSSDDDGYVKMGCVENDVERNKKIKVVAGGCGGGGGGGGGRGKKGSGGGGCGGSGGMRRCQADKCMADLSDAKPYHRRHKVCENHAKAQIVLVAGIRQRFCQQCSRFPRNKFHELSEFDETKKSCRRRLAGHNERRRKNAAESHSEGGNHKGTVTQLKDMVCGKVDDTGRIKITIQENATYKHFQIR